MNKAEIIFDAITNIRPALIEEAQDYRFRRRRGAARYGPWLALAACLVIAVGLGSLWRVGAGGAGSDNFSGGVWNGVQAPEAPGDSAPSPGTPDDEISSGENSAAGDAENEGGTQDAAPAVRLEVLVLEVREDGLVAEVLAGDDGLASRTVLLPAENLEAAEGIAAGDTLAVGWSGETDWTGEIPVLLGALTAEPMPEA